MPSFSTQASIEARISANRLNTLIDFSDGVGGPPDGTPDAASLAAGIAFAGSYIAGRLEGRYGRTNIDSWVLPDDVPDLIGKLSDDLCIYQYAVSKPNLFPDNDIILQTVNAMLDSIANGETSIYGVDAPAKEEFQTARIKSDFDPERDIDNQSVRVTWVLPDERKLTGYPE